MNTTLKNRLKEATLIAIFITSLTLTIVGGMFWPMLCIYFGLEVAAYIYKLTKKARI